MLAVRTRLLLTVVCLLLLTRSYWMSVGRAASGRESGRSMTSRILGVRHGVWRPTTDSGAALILLLTWTPWTFVPPALLRRWLIGRTLPAVTTLLLLTGVGILFVRNDLDVSTATGRGVYLGLSVVLGFAFLVQSFLHWRAARHGPPLVPLARFVNSGVALVFGTAWLLFAVEASARAFPLHDSLAGNPGLPHLWPDYFNARNSLGCNDREPGLKRGPRVLVLGDSYAEGAGVSRNERFASRLEQMLRRTHPDVEVFCAGACGLDTFEEADVLDRLGDTIQPDLVVLAYVLNDAEGESPPSRRAASGTERLFLQTLRSYAAYRVLRLSESWGGSGWGEDIRTQHGDDRPGWARARRGLERIAAWCRQRQVRTICVVLPVFAPRQEEFRSTMEKVVGAAQQRGFEARHLLDEFDGHWERFALSSFDSHPNASAHEVIARCLVERIGPVIGGPSLRAEDSCR